MQLFGIPTILERMRFSLPSGKSVIINSESSSERRLAWHSPSRSDRAESAVPAVRSMLKAPRSPPSIYVWLCTRADVKQYSILVRKKLVSNLYVKGMRDGCGVVDIDMEFEIEIEVHAECSTAQDGSAG